MVAFYKTKPKLFLTNSLILRTGNPQAKPQPQPLQEPHSVVAFEKGNAAPGGMTLMGLSWLDTPCSAFSQQKGARISCQTAR